MKTTGNIVQNNAKQMDIDSLDKNVRNQYPLLSQISAELVNKENEMKEMIHAFYERKKAGIIVGEEKAGELNNKFIKILQEKAFGAT